VKETAREKNRQHNVVENNKKRRLHIGVTQNGRWGGGEFFLPSMRD
jgi:hypothetical protein